MCVRERENNQEHNNTIMVFNNCPEWKILFAITVVRYSECLRTVVYSETKREFDITVIV